MSQSLIPIAAFVLLLSACTPSASAPGTVSIRIPTATSVPTSTATLPPTPRPTPDPYEPYTIEYPRSRSYGGGQIKIVEYAGQNSAFSRYLIRYPSDGLWIHGFANVPQGQGDKEFIRNTIDFFGRYLAAP